MTDSPPPAPAIPGQKGASNQVLIDRLRSYSVAYPDDLFPPLSPAERASLPRGIMDRISASMGRHCAKIMAEAADALEAGSL